MLAGVAKDATRLNTISALAGSAVARAMAEVRQSLVVIGRVVIGAVLLR
jgi:hypothetical protein